MTITNASTISNDRSSDDIDLHSLAAALHRNWPLIAKIAVGVFALTGIYAFATPQVWEGEFQIVLSNENSGGNRLAQLAASNPMLSNLAGLSGGGIEDSLETEVRVLESPSVLKPVYNFVRERKQRTGINTEEMRFSDWVKYVKVELEKGTSVLNISYRDTDKELILPVIERISKEYQLYSGRDRRRHLANGVAYLKQSIATLTPKSDASMKRAQDYALSHGLGLQDGLPASSTGGTDSKGNANGSVEANRQEAQAKVALLRQQLASAQAASNRVLFQAPQLEANAELYGRYQQIEAQLTVRRSVLRDNDDLIRNLERQRQSLISTLNRQTIGLLQGQLATAQAALQASSRPKEVVLKHRELVRQALRDERTLVELENQLQLAQLEQAKQADPWELISTPTLLDEPVAPRKIRIMALGLISGLILGSGSALILERLAGRVFSEDDLHDELPGALLERLRTDPEQQLPEQAWQMPIQLLADGPLAEASSIGLIPVGDFNRVALHHFTTLLGQALGDRQLLLSRDLLCTRNCSTQILITASGAATREQLRQLREQLALQGTPVAGWVLLEA